MKKPAIKLGGFSHITWESGPDEDGIYQVQGIFGENGPCYFALFKASDKPKETWKTHKYYGGAKR